jgi:hypothetical protein
MPQLSGLEGRHRLSDFMATKDGVSLAAAKNVVGGGAKHGHETSTPAAN